MTIAGASCGGGDSEGPAGPLAATAFTDVASAAGIAFEYDNGITPDLRLYMVEIAGAGGALFDYDGDGDLDMYAVQAYPIDEEARTAGRLGLDRLFRNELVESGELRFTDVTEESGIAAGGYGMGAAVGDFTNDGYPDLYVLNWGPNQLWRNNGDGTFTEVVGEGGAADPGWSTGATFADFDRDGWLDLMVVNYNAFSLATDHDCFLPSGRKDYCSPSSYPAQRDTVYQNKGDSTFEDVSLQAGLDAAFGPALGVVAADFNADGWLDVFVANDGAENQLWINSEGQGFRDVAALSGTALNAAGRAEASMGVNAADFDGDGDDDLFITHLADETNTFYANNGLGVFRDETSARALGLVSQPYTGFGTAAFDFDNDGDLDLFVANGDVKVVQELVDLGVTFPYGQKNLLLENVGQGRFEDVSPASPAFETKDVSRGTAYGDIDNDGDTDLVVFNSNGPLQLLRNDIADGSEWIGLRIVDGPGGRDALGARVELLRDDGVVLSRRVHTDGGYVSAHDPRVIFGLGGDGYRALRVTWLDGSTEEWADLEVGRYHTLVRGSGVPIEAGP